MNVKIVVLVIFLQGCLSAPALNDNIHQDPGLEIFTNFAKEHLRYDKGFQAAINYFHTDEWGKLYNAVKVSSPWVKFKEFVCNAGLNITNSMEALTENMNGYFAKKFDVDDVKPNLTTFIEGLKIFTVPLVPKISEILHKVRMGEEFARFKTQISSPEAKKLFEDVLASNEAKDVIAKFVELGLNIPHVVDVIYQVMDWDKPKSFELVVF